MSTVMRLPIDEAGARLVAQPTDASGPADDPDEVTWFIRFAQLGLGFSSELHSLDEGGRGSPAAQVSAPPPGRISPLPPPSVRSRGGGPESP